MFWCGFLLLLSAEFHPPVPSDTKEITSISPFSLGSSIQEHLGLEKGLCEDDREMVICQETRWASSDKSRQLRGMMLRCSHLVFETIHSGRAHLASNQEDLLRSLSSCSCRTSIAFTVFSDMLVAKADLSPRDSCFLAPRGDAPRPYFCSHTPFSFCHLQRPTMMKKRKFPYPGLFSFLHRNQVLF